MATCDFAWRVARCSLGLEMDRRVARSTVSTVMLALLPTASWAEVMDKEPTVLRLWTWALLLGIAGFFAWRRHPAVGAFAALVAAVLVWSFHFELADAHVGPAILREAGPQYVVQAYAAMLVCAALHLAGVAEFVRRVQDRWPVCEELGGREHRDKSP